MLKKKNVLAILALLLVFSLGVPETSGHFSVYAEEDNTLTINEGSSVLSVGANTSNAATLHYGNNAWRIIGYDEEKITSLSAGAVDYTRFAYGSGLITNEYISSNLKESIDAFAGNLTAEEQEGVIERTLEGGSANYGRDGYDNDKIRGASVDDAYLWPLSVKEANTVSGALRVIDSTDLEEPENFWWLRTPGLSSAYAGVVFANGRVDKYGYNIGYITEFSVRPAFYLNPEAVLFTSAAYGGKASGSTGPDALKKVEDSSDSTWKVTIKDQSHETFSVIACAATYDESTKQLTVPYKNAATGDDEYISAIIKNSAGAITYYGRVLESKASSEGEAKINLDGKYSEGDTVYIFNEQYKGDAASTAEYAKTDFASELTEVLTAEGEVRDHDWGFTEFTWNGGEDVGYTAAVPNYVCGYKSDHKCPPIEPKGGPVQVDFEEEVTPARCTEGGWTDYTATVTAENSPDGEDHSESKRGLPTTPLGHELTKTEKVEPTCTEEGTEAYWTCERCGKLFSDAAGTEEIEAPIAIEPLGHDMTKTEKVEPTCTEEGTEAYWTCERCEKMFSDEAGETEIEKPIPIPATGHDWGEWTIIRKPTVTEEGEKERICKRDESHIEKEVVPATGVSGTLLARMKTKGDKALVLTWSSIEGAEGYDIFFSRCGLTRKCKYVKTVKSGKTLKWTKKGLKKHKSYKAYVRAYVTKKGVKTYVRKSPSVHAYAGGRTEATYTNPRSVTIKKTGITLSEGGTYKIKAKVNKLYKDRKLALPIHAPRLRYKSSDTNVATVSVNGRIHAVGKGNCTIYVFALNGAKKQVRVTVN